MRSLALQHKAKALAKVREIEAKQEAKAVIQKTEPTGFAGYSFDVVNAQFKRHVEQLKALTDIKDKVSFKQNVLPDYVAYLEDYLKKGEHYSNQVLTLIIFWLIDVNDIPNAFKFGSLAIDQQQIKPQNFKRDLTTAFVETLHDWCERQYKDGQSVEPFLTNTCNKCLSQEWLVSEIIVLNKLYKLRALVAERDNDLKTALVMYQHCVEVNPEKHGVKTKLAAVKAKLEKADNA